MPEETPATESTELDLTRLVTRGLRHHHGRRLISDGDRYGDVPTRWGELFSWVLMLWFMLADGVFFAQQLGWSPGLPWLAGVALVLVLPMIASALGAAGLGALMLTIVFVVTGIVQFINGGFAALFGTHIVPGLIVMVATGLTRVGGLARSAPLLLPVIILVLFIPLFTSDLWLATSRL